MGGQQLRGGTCRVKLAQYSHSRLFKYSEQQDSSSFLEGEAGCSEGEAGCSEGEARMLSHASSFVLQKKLIEPSLGLLDLDVLEEAPSVTHGCYSCTIFSIACFKSHPWES